MNAKFIFDRMLFQSDVIFAVWSRFSVEDDKNGEKMSAQQITIFIIVAIELAEEKKIRKISRK